MNPAWPPSRVVVAPSLLAADFSRLEDEAAAVAAGAGVLAAGTAVFAAGDYRMAMDGMRGAA